MKIRLTVSLTAFILTFIVSIYSNIFFTSFKRGITAFILFYILATIVEKILESEIKKFQEIPEKNSIEKEKDTIEKEKDTIEKEVNQDSTDFKPLNIELLKNKKSQANVEIENMDPEEIARLLNNLDDDNKK